MRLIRQVLGQLRLVDDVGGDELLDLPPLGARHPNLLLRRGPGVVVNHLRGSQKLNIVI